MKVIVNKRACVLDATSKLWKPGQDVPLEALKALGEEEYNRLIAEKVLKEVDESEEGESEEALVQPGVMVLDPDKLKELDKDKLNAMLVERGADAVGSKAKAIEVLSAEFDPAIHAAK